MARLRTGAVPAYGDRLTSKSLEAYDCLAGPDAPQPCSVVARDPRDYAAEGYSYQAQQPPLGYLPYVAFAGDAQGRAPEELLESTRGGGVLWALFTALAVGAIALQARLGRIESAALLFASLWAPVAVHAQATVNNDAALVSAGALGLIAWLRSSRSSALLRPTALCIGLVIGAVKITCLLVPFALLVASALGVWRSPRVPLRDLAHTLAGRRIVVAANLALGTVATTIAWALFQSERASTPAAVVNEALLGFSRVDSLQLDTVAAGLPSVMRVFAPSNVTAPIHELWGLAFYGCVLAAALTWQRRKPTPDQPAPVLCAGDEAADTPVPYALSVQAAQELAIGVLTAAFIIAVAYPVRVYLDGQYNFPTTARYTLTLLPAAGLCFVRILPKYGLVLAGVALPVAAAVWQLASPYF